MAMLTLNLIPPRVRKARTKQMMVSGAMGAVALILALPIAVLMVKYSAAGKLESRLGQVKRESASYTGIIQKVVELTAQEEALAKKLEILDKIVGTQATWIKLLEEVSACRQTVKDLWLTNITSRFLTGADAGKMEISLNGMAFSKPAVADFAKVLRQNGMFTDVDLASLAESTAGGQPAVSFVINVKFKR